MLAFLRRRFLRTLKAGDKRLPEVVHVHPAHADALDTDRLLRKRFYVVAEGIVTDIDAGTVLKSGICFVF